MSGVLNLLNLILYSLQNKPIMRLSSLLFVPAFILATFAAKAETEKNDPAWRVTENKKMAHLTAGQTEAALTFTCDIADAMGGQEIMYSHNSSGTKTMTLDEKGKYTLKLKPGKYVFSFYMNDRFIEVHTDSIKFTGAHRVSMRVHFSRSPRRVVAEKPVIYLYPATTTKINLELEVKGKLEFTYPQYHTGWSVTAHADGKLESNGKTYPYLFWEGNVSTLPDNYDRKTGFMVEQQNLLAFLEEKLAYMGLNATESADFITYWYPRMQRAAGYTYIHFICNNDYDKIAGLNVTPQPDNMLRVFMVWTAMGDINTDLETITPQTLPVLNRTGFTLVEWGGAEIQETKAVSVTGL